VQQPLPGLDRLLVPRAAPRPRKLPPRLHDVVQPVEPVGCLGLLQRRLLFGVELATQAVR
jgi:hypothetical protein